MITYHIIQYSLLIIICTYLVNYYSSKTVSFHIKFWSIITWTLNFAIALLVPEDVYETLNTGNQNQADHEKALKYLGWQYLILYWLVYLLTWTIIPVLQQWQNSGDLSSSDRLKRSLKVNGIFYLWMIIGAIVFLVILIMFDVGGQMGLITFLKCLATIWGLLLLMGLMGYALVEIPKTLWNNADAENFLNYLYTKIVQVQDELQQSYQQFTKIIGFILYSEKQTKSSKQPKQQSDQILRYCQQSKKIIPREYEEKINHKNYYKFLQNIDYLKDYPISLQSSIEHLRLLKRNIAECKRLERSLDYYLKKAILYEDILASLKGKQLQNLKLKCQVDELNEKILGQTVNNTNKSLYTNLFQPKWYHSLWYLSLRRPVNKALAVIIGTFSLILMISETQVFLTNDSSILRWLLRIENYQILRIVVFIVIAFIMYMVNYSLFRLKISNLYGLYYKDSDGPSLMFATVNFSRVGVVIVLNFFDMMKMDSEYENVMGTVNMGLLGQWVIKGLPGVLWLIVLTHFFNLWSKLMEFLKLSYSFGFHSHDVKSGAINFNRPYLVIKKRQKIQKQMQQKHIKN